MIRIFDEAQGAEEAGAVVHGGLLVTATDRTDVEKLVRLCLELRAAPPLHRLVLDLTRERWEPMRSLYADFLLGGTDVLENLNNETGDTISQGISSLASNGAKDTLDYLTLGLGTVVNLWQDQATAASDGALQLFLAVANPATHSSAALDLAFMPRRAVLVLQFGSLLPSLVVEGSIKGYGWVIAIAAKGTRVLGRTAQAAGNRLVEGAREQARKRAKYPDLLRLDQLNENNRGTLRGRQLVIVFLHGIFSTDLGTFDGFIDRLYATDPRTLLSKIASNGSIPPDLLGGRPDALTELRETLQAKVDAYSVVLRDAKALHRTNEDAVNSATGFVGWPHNSLTAISTNANNLADTLENTFMPNPPKIMLVCHSRGGLVARAAIANLLEIESRREIWSNALVGMITFGTPHDGASIAEHTLRDQATYFLLMQSTRKVTSLMDVLTYLDARTAEGLEQLKRDEATTETRPQAFTDALYARERNLVKDSRGRRMPPVMAIGGKLDNKARATWRSRAASALGL